MVNRLSSEGGFASQCTVMVHWTFPLVSYYWRVWQSKWRSVNSPVQIWNQMLYKISDLPFRANFWSTNNAVRVKAIVRYCKEFKILVNPAHSIKYPMFIMRKSQKGGKYIVRSAKPAIEISRDPTTHII